MTKLSKWYFNGEEVEKTRWNWEVEYDDGEILKQYDDNGVYHQLKEIDLSRINIFRVTNGEKIINFRLEKGEKPFFLIRNYLLNNGRIRERVFVCGIENKIYCYIISDRLIISTKDE